MLSSACKHAEHSCCHHKGKVRLACRKTIRCSCSCHASVDVRPKWVQEQSRREAKQESEDQ